MGEVSLKALNKEDFKICWTKLDRKSKKVNFLISNGKSSVEGKATAETMEEVGEQIEALQFKLDSISQNIVTQLETGKLHFQSK